MISTGDVIWDYDGTIRPPKRKMCVCICPDNGFFFRINSSGHWNGSVPISQKTYSDFLHHDSYVECNGPLEIDDTSINESIRVDGIIGTLNDSDLTLILECVMLSRTLRANDQKTIIEAIKRVVAR